MKYLNLKTLATGLAALLLMPGIFVNQAIAAPPQAKHALVVVAKSGGDYTTITEALAAINPTATNPYVIEVWPGVYTEPDTIHLKSYVHLKGSGRDVTTLKFGSYSNVAQVYGKTNVTISGFTVTGGDVGIDIWSTTTSANSVTITDNAFTNINWFGIRGHRPAGGATNTAVITGNDFTAVRWAGINLQNTSATITRNFFSGIGEGRTDRSDSSIGIGDSGNITYVITENVINGNNGIGVYMPAASSPIVSDNIITNNALGGIKFGSVTGGVLTNNKVINNGGALYADIDTTFAGQPNISFNVFNSIIGVAGVGSYNVNSNGDPILVP